jgi:hypothetical protein
MAHKGRYEGESFKDWWKRRQRENRMNWRPGFQDYGQAGADLGSVVSGLTDGVPDMETNEYTVLPGESIAEARARIFGTSQKQKKKTVITRVDDPAVADKEVTTIEDVDDEIQERIEPVGQISVDDQSYPSVDDARQGTAAEFGVVKSPPWSLASRFGSQRWREGAADATPGGRGVFGPSDLERQAIAEVNPESRWAAESLIDVPGTQQGAVDEVLPHLSDPDVLRRIQDWRSQNGSITADQIERIRTDIYNERKAAAAQEGNLLGYTGEPDDLAEYGPPLGQEEVGQEQVFPPPVADTITSAGEPVPVDIRGAQSEAGDNRSSVSGKEKEEIDPATAAELERQWGKWTYKPKERRDKFMQQLNNIYAKGAMLDAIAAFSGGKSRSAEYIERAIGKLDAITKFDQEERIYNIWHDVYYNSEGVYDPPKSKKEAADRARRLGASPAETKAIYGWAEEGRDLQQWWRYAPDGTVEVTQMTGKKEEPEQGDGAKWRQGSGPTRSTTTVKVPWRSPDGKSQYTLAEGVTPESIGMGPGWTIGTKDPTEGNVPGGKPEIVFIENVYARNGYGEAGKAAAVEALVARMRVDPGIYGIIGEFKDDLHRASAVRMVDNWIREYEARGRESYSSQGRHLDAADTTTTTAPTETREEYEARVRKRYPDAPEERIQATVAAQYG